MSRCLLDSLTPTEPLARQLLAPRFALAHPGAMEKTIADGLQNFAP